jgi:hypothetical protein
MIKSLGVKFDFIFIDGDHSYEGVRNDYEKFKQFLASDGFMAFHDIVYSEENLQNNARVDILWNELNTYGLEKYQFVSRLRNHSYRTDQLFYTFVSKRPYESWGGIGVIKNSPIGLFCHSYLKNHWYDVVLSQLVKLQNSGLYKRADKIVYGVQSERDDNYYTLLDIIKQYDVDSKIEVYRHNKNMYEYSTLMHLQNYCAQNPNASVLYYHTKGTSREFDKNIESWRECLEYFNIEQWRRCFDAVNSDRHDVCGAMYVNWFKFLDIEMKNYYSGNFWWAQAKHINTLDNLGAVMLQNNAKRDYCELWLGSKPHRWASLYSISLNSWYDHYFDPKDYKNV